MFIGSGIARIIQLKKDERSGTVTPVSNASDQIGSAPSNNALPSAQTQWASPESRYKTGDLVPPSVTEA